MRKFLVSFAIALSVSCYAQNPTKGPDVPNSSSKSAPDKKTQIDADAVAVIARMNAPKLPTPSEAAREAALHGASSDEIAKAYRDAQSAERKAIKAGQSYRVSYESLQNYAEEVHAAEMAKLDAEIAKSDAEIEAAKKRCPGSLKIGAPEADVKCLLGSPDHVNTDELGSDQLVYNKYIDGTERKPVLFVYVNHRTRLVEDVQRLN